MITHECSAVIMRHSKASNTLTEAVRRGRSRLHVTGHVHGAYGARLDANGERMVLNAGTMAWQSAPLAVCDLTLLASLRLLIISHSVTHFLLVRVAICDGMYWPTKLALVYDCRFANRERGSGGGGGGGGSGGSSSSRDARGGNVRPTRRSSGAGQTSSASSLLSSTS